MHSRDLIHLLEQRQQYVTAQTQAGERMRSAKSLKAKAAAAAEFGHAQAAIHDISARIAAAQKI